MPSFLREQQQEQEQEQEQQQQQQIQLANPFYNFKGKPFWFETKEEHRAAPGFKQGECCFNHIIGLPRKDAQEKPIFDYEWQIHQALLQKSKRDIFIKKARGLGITELLLRHMCWLCVYDNTYRNTRFHIVTGPRINLATELIDRIDVLFKNVGISCPRVGHRIDVNGVTIEAFPSYTMASSRGYTDVKFILVDEADFFPPGQQSEVRAVCEAYGPKSSPWVVFVSTPYKPGGLFDTIEHETPSKYHKLYLDYTLGLGKIYKTEEIENERKSPSFEREFNLKYSFGVGNVFTEAEILAAEELGRKYSGAALAMGPRSLGIDPGFGSSKTAFVMTELVDNLVRVVYCKQFPSASTDDMVKHAADLILDNELYKPGHRTFIDGSQTGFIRSVKSRVGEFSNYELLIDRAKRDGRADQLQHYMQVVPVSFATKHKAMLGHVKKYLSMRKLAIDPALVELTSELRIAESNEEMDLSKRSHSHDLLDALRLALELYLY